MTDVDDQIARARAAMERIAGDYTGVARGHQQRVRRAAGEVGRRFRRVAIADATILAAVVLFSFVIAPIGFFGFFAVILLLCAVNLFLLLSSTTPRPPTEERLRQVEVKALPAQTGRWLQAQRPALPAPAVRLVDRIGQRLDALTPQLARVGDDSEEAREVKKLVGEQLPAFIQDYGRVPPTLRGVDRNGRTPDAELVDGLTLIEQEIGDMTQRLAAGDLDQLSTRGRYLEMRYKDENPER
ncbi:hypothetical protein [Sphingomonas sp.]|uniref:hypothetical protein n=1 Tax=Sphingomonas sp. TaxID=28214 RepID=UPI003CC66D95